ncbi:hypothetical protein E6P09_02495 [Haloferax mediterranei ATCC 33500]|nr:hypothetical protein [Haloferax mediterranei]AHZ22932.1 hypothetical protein BM92_09915 [Haloferax mediterranei ATCC 33500]MDX5987721.1 hypothetical protein [Haloferax mediterranei ATCC 33500]QCQ76564.1 hypothetical protein E6P09_02495 [Haloferax mediterranei ATCC 33500]
MSRPSDDDFQRPVPTDPIDDTPTVFCSRCNEEWDLSYELDELQLGNQSVEQFALDHHRHTGHFPDGVTPWVVSCRQCPDGEQFLSETPARRWARTHARHTRHDVALSHADDEQSIIAPE